jgi:hypothetical protein
VKWLEEKNVPGSIAGGYSLYTAIDDEYEQARKMPAGYRRRRQEQQ